MATLDTGTGACGHRPEYGGHGEVAAVPWVAGDHHVLGVEHLLGELGHAHGPVRLAAAGRERREPWHEEMEPGERDHVDGELAEVGVQLAGEPEARGHAGHGQRHQVVEVAVRRVGQLQCPETYVVQRLVVQHLQGVEKKWRPNCATRQEGAGRTHSSLRGAAFCIVLYLGEKHTRLAQRGRQNIQAPDPTADQHAGRC